ncbi:hypothetical protein HMI54_009186 [Coelomomyces lativittatus]|nr:hypothetical protein HMI54_009186 [Coelomomyces lativittatus]KAJ1504120.1 hypothetical protein HMI56_001785 [Coelomomyces lativittatus]KAJ1504641.1 hypothetical protein HMI55_001931 [Coelomomyces lativittatus]
MFSFFVLFSLFPFLFTSILASNSDTTSSQNKLGIQSKHPLTFTFANYVFEFGPFKATSSQTTSNSVGFDLMIFLTYFATALDAPTTNSGEISDAVFAETLANSAKDILTRFEGSKGNSFLFQHFLNTDNQKWIQDNHQAIKAYFLSIKPYLSEIVQSTAITCYTDHCDFTQPLPRNEWTSYSDFLLYHTYSRTPALPPSWNQGVLDSCQRHFQCVVEGIRKMSPSNPVSPGSTLQTTSLDDDSSSTAIQGFQRLSFYLFFMVSVLNSVFFYCF